MAVILNLVAMDIVSQPNCQVCPVPYVPISIRSTCYNFKVLATLGFVSILPLYVFQSSMKPRFLTSNRVNFQIFAYIAFACSSLLIVLRM